MSLDIWLTRKRSISYDDGKTFTEDEEEVFDANITHNLGTMAAEAGIYYALWRPENIDAKYAKDIIKIIEDGLFKLKADEPHYKQFEASNGWGTYKDFIPWIEEYLEALKTYPDSKISTSR